MRATHRVLNCNSLPTAIASGPGTVATNRFSASHHNRGATDGIGHARGGPFMVSLRAYSLEKRFLAGRMLATLALGALAILGASARLAGAAPIPVPNGDFSDPGNF